MEEHDCCKNKIAEKGIKSYLLVGMVTLVFLVLVFQSFQINSLKTAMAKSQITGNAGIDMSGWTENDKMMYEHHGVLPLGLQPGAKPAGSNMIGGC